MVRVAINGFGRIGRMVLRAGIDHPDIEFVAINDLTKKEVLRHLLKHDSVHGGFSHEVTLTDNGFAVDGKEIRVLAERDPGKLPWKDLDVDIVVESTGFFRTKEKVQPHLEAGAKKVLISAPGKSDGIKTIVFGVNEHTLSADDNIVSNASCTTNCLAPIVKVLDDNFGIEEGFMTTVHAYTADQRLVDAPHSDLRRARSAALSIVPTSTGAAQAVTQVLPHLKGKLDGLALRVPVPDGSITDFVCQLRKEVTVQEINDLFSGVASRELKNIIEATDEPLVSSDIVGNRHSSIVDLGLTKVLSGRFVKIISWYDNEFGYSCRMVDLLVLLGKTMS